MKLGDPKLGIGVFVERKHQPTMKEVISSIGSKREMWNDLNRFITEKYRVKRDFAFYGTNYGWAIRFRKGGKALLSMYPGEDSFTVQVVLSRVLAEEAFGLNLGSNVRNVLEKARDFPEGRWLFIRVGSRQDLNDVQRLLKLKTSPSQRK